jgi:MFS family permease
MTSQPPIPPQHPTSLATPLGTSSPPPPSSARPIVIEKRWISALIGAGVGADLALRVLTVTSLATSMSLIALAVGLLVGGRISTRQGRTLIGLAVLWAAMLSIRTDPRLAMFNVAAVGLLLLVATMRESRVGDLRPSAVLAQASAAAVEPVLLVVETPGYFRAAFCREANGRRELLLPVMRGIAIAVPLAIVLGSLLGSADVVFASFFSHLGLSPILGHLLLFGVGAGCMATVLRLAHRDVGSPRPLSTRSLGRVETLIVLVTLDLLFASFVFAQLLARSDAGDALLMAEGLTYRSYARGGFFQLLWVASITMTVLLALRSSTAAWARRDRLFLASSMTAVVLTLVIVMVAVGRLHLYIDDNGLTPLRFYSTVFSVWIGIGFALVALRIGGWRSGQAWMTSALVGSGLVVLFALNVANPEAIIARHNLARPEQRSILFHVDKLTEDGRAVLAADIDRFEPKLRAELRTRLCEDESALDSDRLLHWNLGRRNAGRALTDLCR